MLFAGFKVIIAAEGDQKILLQQEFPTLEIVHLPGYKLKYSVNKTLTILKIFFQIPKILIAINREKRWLRSFLRANKVSVVIADNRFGLHNKDVISIFVTHQLHINSLLGKWADAIVQSLNYSYINQFDYCWVPDAAGEINLAGNLSHPAKKPNCPVEYIGVLSRIKQISVVKKQTLLILLSGPEPQRSILDKVLMEQLTKHHLQSIVVCGLPGIDKSENALPGITRHSHLPAHAIEALINEAEIIVCRSGYSTLMDILPLGKKCIVIPTPGQGEQEYLANLLSEKGYACAAQQENVDLPILIEKAKMLQLPNLASLKNDQKLETLITALQTELNQTLA
ncbi:MAG: glycosyltransferase [Chitinophagaceae bacterium]